MTFRVLVVDDHRSLRDLFEICFSMEEDLELVATASDGRQAVELATALVPDAIVLDWELPIMDGFEVLPQLRRAAPGAAVVVFSATNDPATATMAMSNGADRYLVKDDSDIADVITALRESCSSHRLSA